jgi:hypothetical protein
MHRSFWVSLVPAGSLFTLHSLGASAAAGPQAPTSDLPKVAPSPAEGSERAPATLESDGRDPKASTGSVPEPDSGGMHTDSVTSPRPALVARRTAQDEAEERVSAAPDTLGSHLIVAVNLGWALPFGSLARGIAQTDVMSSGPVLSLDLGYGVSRTLVIGLWGQGQSFGAGQSCSGCHTAGYAVGPLLRYHLAQGVRFDPWIAAGPGWRFMTLRKDATDFDYSGPEWMRVMVGGDWYPRQLLGVGPWLELGAGSYTNRPTVRPLPDVNTAPDQGAAWNWLFAAGLRGVLDTPGK